MKRVFFLVLAAVMITGLFTGCQSMYTTGRNGSATPYATDELYGNVSTTRNGYVNGENRGKYNIDARNTTDQMDNATGYVKYPNSYSGTPMGGTPANSYGYPSTNSTVGNYTTNNNVSDTNTRNGSTTTNP